MSRTTKVKSFFIAIIWGMIAFLSPKSAVAEMKTARDPNHVPAYLDFYPFTYDCAIIAEATGISAAELVIIRKAAVRNKCFGDDFLILLAIRMTENGRPGLEFGVMHWRCRQIMARRPGETMDIQAGWAAATIVKTRVRWNVKGRPDGFIRFLADRYCPASVDPAGNEYWKINVTYWTAKLRGLISGQL